MLNNAAFARRAGDERQELNQRWWETRPMTYDWDGVRAELEGSSTWYQALDEEFWKLSRVFAHPRYPQQAPFSELIDYSSLRGKSVLEIGCGSGAHAALLAAAGATVTAIDLTSRAVTMTKRRQALFDVSNLRVMQSDAEHLPFEDCSFDFVWSWGVIHHSSDTARIVGEIRRVLRPGGRARVMVYHRRSTRYWVYGGLYRGLLRGELLRLRSLYAVNMTFTDGYIARHYTRAEGAALFAAFNRVSTRVMDGSVPAMMPGWNRLSSSLPVLMRPLNRAIRKRWGWFLVIDAIK
jgi:ubiquinone/menaquinone biosynthesis C-methylase UbiE